ncbi:MAG: phosphoketolase family protein [Elusimicrobiales bacterium]|nr:phosphoketolase family protein [Elusimicrobiales bacterium]
MEKFRKIDEYWRAANYIACGMIYLRENPVLKEPLKKEHIKDRLLGHWGASPQISFSYIHTNEMIKKYNSDCLFVVGPGHGAPGYIAPIYLEGTLTEYYPQFSQNEEGLKLLFKSFSFPGGLGSHCTPELPGTIQEGGELGYTLSHAFGAAFDNSNLIVVAVVGDGEAETGPLATSWHGNKFINPIRDGAVLPILSLNGYKINNPTLLSRIDDSELLKLFEGYGYEPIIVDGSNSFEFHEKMNFAMDRSFKKIFEIWEETRKSNVPKRPHWPLIILRMPKGFGAPKYFDGHFIEDYWRAHQVPFSDAKNNEKSLKMLEEWLKSYKPWELFDEKGTLREDLQKLNPPDEKKMGKTKYSNGGVLRKPLIIKNIEEHFINVEKPLSVTYENTRTLGRMLTKILENNPNNFRIFGPDETHSNRLGDVFKFGKVWMDKRIEKDLDEGWLDPFGRTIEMLSEHTVEGMLEGYLLTGRYGIISTYEGFAPIISSMVNQFGKWLDISSDLHWREPISSLNILLTSVVWRQDHNGFTHQDPGFINAIVDKWPQVVRLYFPPDANTLVSTAEMCFKSTNRINIIIIDKQKHVQYLNSKKAFDHAVKGISIWEFASSNINQEPDVVIASCGDIPTKEAVAASLMLRDFFPELNIRFVNVVNLFRLTPETEHPDGLSDLYFDSYFTRNKPVIFNFHGYPWLIHRLTYRRTNHSNIHVRGYRENRKIGIDATHIAPFLKGRGGITTPMQLAILNQIDRFSIAMDVIDRVEKINSKGGVIRDKLKDMQIEVLKYSFEHGIDPKEYSDEVFFSKYI